MMERVVGKLPPFVCTIIVVGLILYLTLFPDPLPEDTPKLFPHADKLVHAIMFGSFFCAYAFDRCRQQAKLSLTGAEAAILLGVTIMFGGGIEKAQELMKMGRGGDILDFIADTVGAAAALAVYPLVNKFLLVCGNGG